MSTNEPRTLSFSATTNASVSLLSKALWVVIVVLAFAVLLMASGARVG